MAVGGFEESSGRSGLLHRVQWFAETLYNDGNMRYACELVAAAAAAAVVVVAVSVALCTSSSGLTDFAIHLRLQPTTSE